MSRTLTMGWLLALSVLLTTIGCSATARERFKHWFFEVPAETKTAPAAAGDGHGAVADADASATNEPVKSRYQSVHPPFSRRMCAACHNPDNRMQVRNDYRDRCQSCHVRYFSDEVGHLPVSEDCSTCHVPHQSAYPSLLVDKLYSLCTDCHDEEDVWDAHDVDEDDVSMIENCMTCHDAHFGDLMK